MGRYYNGSINGKFWFAVQSSNAADRFGVTGCEPGYLDYYFDNDNLEDVENEINNIISTIGEENIKIMDEFFARINGYNDTIMTEHGVLELFEKHKIDYADMKLGIQIRDCIKTEGQCSFQAEL